MLPEIATPVCALARNDNKNGVVPGNSIYKKDDSIVAKR